MTKRIFLSLICFASLCVSAQKELYFESGKEDSISITSLQGFYGGVGLNFGSVGVNGSFNIGYLNELKIGKTTSLILGASVFNSVYRKYTFPEVTYSESSYAQSTGIGTYSIAYGIQLSLSAETRWYLNYKKRSIQGKDRTLNSGWFFGLPVEVTSSILNSDTPLNMELFIAPSLGFRRALTEKLYLEGAAGIGCFVYDFSILRPAPYLRIKAAYTF